MQETQAWQGLGFGGNPSVFCGAFVEGFGDQGFLRTSRGTREDAIFARVYSDWGTLVLGNLCFFCL